MKDIKVVIGANYGDEGKGLIVDYFCNHSPYNKPILNVRFNGGSHAKHTVVIPDGRRHEFSHIGAGSFNENVITYLSSFFLVNPFHFETEYKQLINKGLKPKVMVSRQAKVVTIYDIFFNQMLELSKKKNKYGTCGCGIFETINRNNNEDYTLTVQDICQSGTTLFYKLKEIRDEYFKNRLKENNLNVNDTNYKKVWNADIFILSFIDEAKEFLNHVELVEEEEILNRYEYQIYEGAEGLLLDKNNKMNMPFITPTNTGLDNVIKLLSNIRDDNIKKEVCYVTRSYFTRHGAGPFSQPLDNSKYKLEDKTNIETDWQGNMRYGYFDLELFKSTIKKDFNKLKGNKSISVAITHLDETKGKILLKDSLLSASSLKSELKLNNLYFSFGENRKNVSTR